MKRLLIAATAATLMLVPMTAYGAQTEEGKAVYQEIMNTSKQMSDLNAFIDMDIKMTGSSDTQPGAEESINMRMEMNTRLKGMQDLANMKYQTYARVSIPELSSDVMEMSMYMGDGYYYMNLDGQKVKTKMPVNEMAQSILDSTQMMNNSLEFMKDLSVETDGENRILHYTMDDTMLNNFIQTYMATLGMNDLMSSSQMKFSISNIKGSYIVNPQGYYTKCYMNMDMSISVGTDTIKMQISADMGIADPGQPVEITPPNSAEYVEQSL